MYISVSLITALKTTKTTHEIFNRRGEATNVGSPTLSNHFHYCMLHLIRKLCIFRGKKKTSCEGGGNIVLCVYKIVQAI